MSLNPHCITELNTCILILKINCISKDWADLTYHTHGNDLGVLVAHRLHRKKKKTVKRVNQILIVFKSRQLRVLLAM